MERSEASNTFTARTEPLNREAIHAQSRQHIRDSEHTAVIARCRNEGRGEACGGAANGRQRAMTASLEKGSKVFELLEGGTAAAEGRKEKAQCLCEGPRVSRGFSCAATV